MDQEAWQCQFERWVDRFGPELYQTCLHRVGGRTALAEELLHETYLTAWQKREQFTGSEDGARRWLHRIAYHLAPKIWRHNRFSLELTPELLLQIPAPPLEREDAPEAAELACLHAGFDRLEPLDRLILQLRFGLCPDLEADDTQALLTWQEVAATLTRLQGLPFEPDQVRMRARRALIRLREALGNIRLPREAEGLQST